MPAAWRRRLCNSQRVDRVKRAQFVWLTVAFHQWTPLSSPKARFCIAVLRMWWRWGFPRFVEWYFFFRGPGTSRSMTSSVAASKSLNVNGRKQAPIFASSSPCSNPHPPRSSQDARRKLLPPPTFLSPTRGTAQQQSPPERQDHQEALAKTTAKTTAANESANQRWVPQWSIATTRPVSRTKIQGRHVVVRFTPSKEAGVVNPSLLPTACVRKQFERKQWRGHCAVLNLDYVEYSPRVPALGRALKPSECLFPAKPVPN